MLLFSALSFTMKMHVQRVQNNSTLPFLYNTVLAVRINSLRAGTAQEPARSRILPRARDSSSSLREREVTPRLSDKRKTSLAFSVFGLSTSKLCSWLQYTHRNVRYGYPMSLSRGTTAAVFITLTLTERDR